MKNIKRDARETARILLEHVSLSSARRQVESAIVAEGDDDTQFWSRVWDELPAMARAGMAGR